MSTIRKLKTGFHSLRAVGFGIIWSVVRYRVQRPWAEARFAAGQTRPTSWPRTFITLLRRTMAPHSPTYRFLGDITSFDYHDQSLIITCGQATVRIEVLAPDLMRIRLAPDGHFGDGFSYAIEKTEWPGIDLATSPARLQKHYFEQLIRDPQSLQPGIPMPSPVKPDDSAREIESLWNWLKSLAQ